MSSTVLVPLPIWPESRCDKYYHRYPIRGHSQNFKGNSNRGLSKSFPHQHTASQHRHGSHVCSSYNQVPDKTFPPSAARGHTEKRWVWNHRGSPQLVPEAMLQTNFHMRRVLSPFAILSSICSSSNALASLTSIKNYEVELNDPEQTALCVKSGI